MPIDARYRDPLIDLAEDAIAFLQTKPFMIDLPYLTEDSGDINQMVESALAKGAVKEGTPGKAGVAVLFLVDKLQRHSERPGTKTVNVTFQAWVYENWAINRAATGYKKNPRGIALNLIHFLDGWMNARKSLRLDFQNAEFSQDRGINTIALDFSCALFVNPWIYIDLP